MICALPTDFNKLELLETVCLDGNRLTELSPALFNLPNVTYLDLSDNLISDITFVSKMQTLEVLRLSGNIIESIPSTLKSLKNLTSLHLNDNQISGNVTIPESVEKFYIDVFFPLKLIIEQPNRYAARNCWE